MRDSMLKIIQSSSVDLETVALAADVIAADARFNLWMATTGKKQSSGDRIFQLMDLYEDSIEECRAIAAAVGNDEPQRHERLRRVAAKLRDAVT